MNKQDDVGEVHGEAKDNVHAVGVAVQTVVDNDCQSSKHLQNLKRRDGLAEPIGEADFESGEGIVGIHDAVNNKVHRRKPSAMLGSGDPCMPTEEQRNNVVVVMKEAERPLPQYDEQSVNELGNLAHAKEHHPRSQPFGIRCAQVIHDTLFFDDAPHGRQNEV